MNAIHRIMTNICSDQLAETRDFYTVLFDFGVDYDSDWFVHLISKDKQFELGVMKRDHELVPDGFQQNPQGFYITFVVSSADTVYEQAKAHGFEILEEPTDTFYGQRRVLLKDPNGALVDVSSPIPGFGG
ncbi:MAG: VOC family protein [Bacteroidota bacterium]